jgi:hypothetical protein
MRLITPLLCAFCLLCVLTKPVHAQLAWTLRHQNTVGGEFLWSVTEGNAGIVAVGTHGKILHSVDAKTWTTRNSGFDGWLVAVTYGSGRYIAVGESGTILSSTDAITWRRVAASGTTARLNNVLFGSDRFVAVGEAGVIVTSLDGERWTPVQFLGAGVNGWLRGLAFARVNTVNVWVATGEGGAMPVSFGGTNWSRFSTGTSEDAEAAVAVRSSTFGPANLAVELLAVGSAGNASILNVVPGFPITGYTPTYRDPTTRREVAGTGSAARLRTLTYGNGVFVATGENGAVLTAQSQNGPWTPLNLNTTQNLVGGGFVQGTLLLVGENETIFQSEQLFTSRLGNVSTRGLASSGSGTMIAGTYIDGTRPKQMLVRAVGPSLAQFDVSSPLADPVLSVFDAAHNRVATNTGWSTNLNSVAIAAAAAANGAFPLAANSRDSALLVTLNPGAYTFQLSSASGTAGNALIEAYDLDPVTNPMARAINLSTRGQVGSNDVLTAGLVVQGQSSRNLLIRGIGPGLADFGVSGALVDPVVRVLAADGTLLAMNDNWSTTTLVNGRAVTADNITDAQTATGAFPLRTSSRDSALLITLIPGNYTIQLSGVNNATGIALIEAYDVP